jgi:anti-sigma factor RsiW
MSAAATYVCRQFVEDVTAYLEGILPEDVVAQIEGHLADCPHCREYLREMQRTVTVTGSIGATHIDAMPEELRERLLRAFLERDR